MRRFLVPQTSAGRWAMALGILFLVTLFVQLNDVIPLPALLIFGSGLAAMGTGLFAWLRRGDRTLWALLGLAEGLIVIGWAIAEIVGPPH